MAWGNEAAEQHEKDQVRELFVGEMDRATDPALTAVAFNARMRSLQAKLAKTPDRAAGVVQREIDNAVLARAAEITKRRELIERRIAEVGRG